MGETSVKKTKFHSLSWIFKNSGCLLCFPVSWAGGRGLGTALITVPGGELVGLAGEIDLPLVARMRSGVETVVGVHQLRGDLNFAVLGGVQHGPQLAHEHPRVLPVQEPSQVDLHLPRIRHLNRTSVTFTSNDC